MGPPVCPTKDVFLSEFLMGIEASAFAYFHIALLCFEGLRERTEYVPQL